MNTKGQMADKMDEAHTMHTEMQNVKRTLELEREVFLKEF